ITTKAADGPEMLKRAPPVSAITKPAIAAVYNPYCGGTPLAMARAIASGIAIMPTVRPANRSLRNLRPVYGSLKQLSRTACPIRRENKCALCDICLPPTVFWLVQYSHYYHRMLRAL